MPVASIVIPTRGRPGYLDVALGSVVPQATPADAEVIVVGEDAPSATVAARHGVRYIQRKLQSGTNAARNTGIGASESPLIVLIDDDIEAPPGWLDAYLTGADSEPGHSVFGGPIRAALDGGGPRVCGRESPPITTLDRGSEDRDVDVVWSANMALRREAFEEVGPFDEELLGTGEEEDWQRRYADLGGRVRYLAGAGVEHRRTGADAKLRALARSAYSRGREARRYDVRKGTAPRTSGELRTLAGCAWHTVRRRCAGGIVMGAHTAGRLREALVDRGNH